MASFLVDTFTEASDTALQSHTPDVGGTWSEHPNYTGGITVNSAGGYAEGDSPTVTGIYTNSAVPSSADYYVEAELRNSAAEISVGIAGRASSASTSFYYAFRDEDSVILAKFVNGVYSLLSRFVYDVGVTSVPVRLVMEGSIISVLVDGVEEISLTDTSLSSAGVVGIGLRAGTRVDNLVAGTLGATFNPAWALGSNAIIGAN